MVSSVVSTLPRHTEIAAVNVQWMREPQRAHAVGQRGEDLPRRDAVAGVLLVQIELALIELEGVDAARG